MIFARPLCALAFVVFAIVATGTAPAASQSDEFVPPWSAEVDAALAFFESGDTEAAIERLEPLAEAGDVDAQYILGSIHARGIGVAEDRCRALPWFQRAAAQDDSRAIAWLGVYHQLGDCMPKDYDEAARYFKQAAELGQAGAYVSLALLHSDKSEGLYDPILTIKWAKKEWDVNKETNKGYHVIVAALILGSSYKVGKGVSVNLEKAAFYSSFAANQGLHYAQFLLGKIYEIHRDPARRYTQGYEWIFLAAYQGNEDAIALLHHFYGKVPEWMITNLRRAARDRLFEIAARPRSQIGKAAQWCQSHKSGSFECLRFAFSDHIDCDPYITATYLEQRYVKSAAYKHCRSRAFDARAAKSGQ